jgi:hypothetical protein
MFAMVNGARSLFASALTVALVHAAATGCGGQSSRNEGADEAGGMAGDGGGTATGGVAGVTAAGGDAGAVGGASGGSIAGTGATVARGGTPAIGGTSPGGGAAGTAAAAGSGGAAGEPALCSLEADPGPCRAAMQRWAFDATTGLCMPFVYGGCDGNENNFQTIESCYATCKADTPSLAACESPSDCTLVRNQCCGCDEPSLGNMVAVNAHQAGALQKALRCELVDCATCDSVSNPWLGATCSEGRCIAFDARQNDLTSCAMDAECSLRAGVECCEPCSPDPGDYVALSSNPRELACGTGGCDLCLPVPPAGMKAACVSERCAVVSPPD